MPYLAIPGPNDLHGLTHHLDAIWSGPCICVGCDRRFADDDDVVMIGGDPFCDVCAPKFEESADDEAELWPEDALGQRTAA